MRRAAAALSLVSYLVAACAPRPVPQQDDARASTPAPHPPPALAPLGLAGEWEPAERLLVSWADQTDDLAPFFAEVIAAAVNEVEVTVVVSETVDASPLYAQVARLGVDLSRLRVEPAPLDTMWIRDYGPLVVRTETGRKIMDFAYSAERPGDDRLPGVVAERWGLPLKALPIDLEGGHIQADGMGRCIVTESLFTALGDLSAIAEADIWRDLGCTEISTVPGLNGEATGHLDMFAYVTGPGSVIVGKYAPGEDDDNAIVLDEAALTLEDAGFQVRRIPMPGNSTREIFRTYTNALALNDVVLVPVYGDDSKFESEALAVFRDAFPERRVIAIASDEIIRLAGAVHCVTMTSSLSSTLSEP